VAVTFSTEARGRNPKLTVTRRSGDVLANEPCTSWRLEMITSPGPEIIGTASRMRSDPLASTNARTSTARWTWLPGSAHTPLPGVLP
jgi:hypothetical protein